MTRRTFLDGLAASSATVALGAPFQEGQIQAGVNVSITVNPGNRLASVPRNYSGLSYESRQLAQPAFFAPTNKGLISFFRRLAKQGVLRLGGNTSENTVWSPEGAPADTAVVGPDAGPGPRPRTPVTPEAIRNLAGFLDATGWQLIYGLNLGKGTPEQAAQEAKAVSDSVGHRLIAFAIGNEPDLYHRNRRSDSRPAGWNFDSYLSQWREFAQAVRKAVPGASFSAPEISNVVNRVDWIEKFVEQAGSEIVLVSGHYYAEGPPEDPRMTIERLLERDPRLLPNTPRTMEAARKCHHPFRMTEGNSCYNGGKRGVSDTFASALWAGEYMLFLAQSGYAGVNFHGGGNGIYTPIAGDIEAGFSARPIFYGLLLAEEFAGTTMVETLVDAKDVNINAYVAKPNSGLQVAIFNKDERQAIRATLRIGSRVRKARLWRLAAASLDSRTGVRLAGAEVSADGAWAPQQQEPLKGARGQYTVDLPAASAALVLVS